MTVATDQLRRVPLFSGLTDRAFEAIAALAEERSLRAGSLLAVQGEPGDTFFLLLEGRVSIERDGALVRELGAGDFLGEIALVDGHARTASATAVTDVQVAVIERAAFSAVMDRFAPVRHGILVALSDRIRDDEAGSID